MILINTNYYYTFLSLTYQYFFLLIYVFIVCEKEENAYVAPNLIYKSVISWCIWNPGLMQLIYRVAQNYLTLKLLQSKMFSANNWMLIVWLLFGKMVEYKITRANLSTIWAFQRLLGLFVFLFIKWKNKYYFYNIFKYY